MASLPTAAWAGWDHELWARGALRELGAEPLFRWDAFSNSAKLQKIPRRALSASQNRQGVCGTDCRLQRPCVSSLRPRSSSACWATPISSPGTATSFARRLCILPNQGQQKLSLWLIEHAYPHTAKSSLGLCSGETLQICPRHRAKPCAVDDSQPGGRVEVNLQGIKPGSVLKLVNEGDGDFLIRISGIPAIFCPDAETARAIAAAD